MKHLGLEEAVVFLGRLERDEVVDLYHSGHAFLNPSTVDNMPNSVLEALACGLPVISTNVGGVPYIVRDGETAVLVAPDNAAEMAQAILSVSRDSRLRSRLIASGSNEVVQYAWDRVRPQWLALYEKRGVSA